MGTHGRTLCGRRHVSLLCLALSWLPVAAGCKDQNTRALPKPSPSRPQAEPRSPALALARLDDDFELQAERFADVQLLRYPVSAFASLSKRERTLLYYLQEAALSGRDIAYAQGYRHNLAVRRTLEAVLESYRGDRSSDAFQALTTYAKRVWVAQGIHHPVSGEKMLPEGLSAADFAQLVQQSDADKLPLDRGENLTGWLGRITPVLFDPTVAAHAPRPDAAPTSAGSASPETYGEAISEILRRLSQARELAGASSLGKTLQSLIAYYETGDASQQQAYLRHLQQDDASTTNLLLGFFETAQTLGAPGESFEALVSLRDPAASKRVTLLAQHARAFEDRTPIAAAYRRDAKTPVAAQSVQAVVAAGIGAPQMPTAVHMPPQASTQSPLGGKTLFVSNVFAARASAHLHPAVLGEFVGEAREEQRARNYGAQGYALHSELHEVLGHTSGRLAPGVAPPATSLREYAAIIEEARADAYALYCLFDAELIRLGLMPSFEVARAAYDDYVRDALLLSLASVAPGEPLREPGRLAARLVVRWARAQDPDDAPSVQRVLRDAKTFFEIGDYLRLRRHLGRLLAELQRITSEGDYDAAKALVVAYAEPIELPLHKQVRARHAALGLPSLVAFLQPRLVAERDGDEVVDVQLREPQSFLAQQLADAQRYDSLPTPR